MTKASAAAKAAYQAHGKKLEVGLDISKGVKGGPDWIWHYLEYNDNAEKTKTVVNSVTMRLPMDYWEIEIQGNHYCKLLTPYRALEWIYIDSLKDWSKKQLNAKASVQTTFVQ